MHTLAHARTVWRRRGGGGVVVAAQTQQESLAGDRQTAPVAVLVDAALWSLFLAGEPLARGPPILLVGVLPLTSPRGCLMIPSTDMLAFWESVQGKKKGNGRESGEGQL
eukprot:1161828-Pelagomonas_calceolata.AAC.4